MRYSEITSLPSSPEEAQNSLMDLVSIYRSKDEASIPMKEILSTLHNQGFDANTRWVMDTLKDKSGVKRILPDRVELEQDEIESSVPSKDEQDKSQEKVQKMASKAARKGVNDAN
jgi:hypothetical protein